MPIVHQPNITYASAAGTPLLGDLYAPEGPGPFPVLVAVPGGAWRISRRSGWREWGEYLATRGYALFAIDYRVSTPSRKAFPEAVCDVLAAIRHVRGEGVAWSLDPERIGLFGASAGAHLAALAALAGDQPQYEPSRALNGHGQLPAHVKTLVGAYGVYDLFRHWQDDLALNPGVDGNVVRNLLGAEPYDDQQIYFDASPIRQIRYARNSLPALIAWGTHDEFVLPLQSESFVRALQQARFNVRTYKALGASHFWINQPMGEPGTDSARFAPHLVQYLAMTL